MDMKNINKEKLRDFIRTSPILFSLGFTLLALLLNAAFAYLNSLLLPQNTWGDILKEVVKILWTVALAVIFGFGFICVYTEIVVFCVNNKSTGRGVYGGVCCRCDNVCEYCRRQSSADNCYPVFQNITQHNIGHVQMFWSVVIFHKNSLS